MDARAGVTHEAVKQDASPESCEATSPAHSLGELKACPVDTSLTTITTSDSCAPDESRSIYHIYHKKESHACISPTTDLTKERFWGPTMKETKTKWKQRKLEVARQKEGLVEVDSSVDDGSFFLHTPYLSFHDPPRVLYYGNSKHAEPVVLIHNSFLWRTWKLQLGPSIARPGVLDPRGVVCWKHNGGDSKAREADDSMLKGYKVKTWRLWGETGKEYVHGVKATRKSGIGPDPDVDDFEDTTESFEKDSITYSHDIPDTESGPARAEEVVYLKWTSPFSRDTRRYHFQYSGLDLYWKGTGTVKEDHKLGFVVHFNHLKLVARPATDVLDETQSEICLGKYTSSVAIKKSGKLELYDSAICRLIEKYLPSTVPQAVRELKEDIRSSGKEGEQRSWCAEVKKTSLYRVIVATAMCMIIGERQKRETVRKVIEAAAAEGAGGSS